MKKPRNFETPFVMSKFAEAFNNMTRQLGPAYYRYQDEIEILTSEIADLRAKQKSELTKIIRDHVGQMDVPAYKKALGVYLYALFGNFVNATVIADALDMRTQTLAIEKLYIEVQCDRCNDSIILHVKACDLKGGNYRGVPICDKCTSESKLRYQKQHAEENARLEALKALPYREYLKTEHWKDERRRALARAEYKCQLCNTGNTVLDVHHRTYENLGQEHYKDLIVLCRSCHAKHHDKEVKS